MFEKEVEQYRNDLESNFLLSEPQLDLACQGFKDGAEFGYNKANEWHYIKDGDLPKTEFSRVDVTVAYINAYQNPCARDCCFDGTNFVYWDDRKPIGWKNVDIFGKIYAWKYPERLPKLPKEVEE